MKTTAHYNGKLDNGNLSIVIVFEGQATAHVEMNCDGMILPNHNLSAKGLKAARKAIDTLADGSIRTYLP